MLDGGRGPPCDAISCFAVFDSVAAAFLLLIAQESSDVFFGGERPTCERVMKGSTSTNSGQIDDFKMARSLLDTDLYKLTMQNAVRLLYPKAEATYRFTNRAKGMKFNEAAYEYIKKAIKDMDNMRLTLEEKKWLRRTCPYFPPDYLDWLLDFKLDSEKQVRIIFNKDEDSEFGELDIASTWLNRLSKARSATDLTVLLACSRRSLVYCYPL